MTKKDRKVPKSIKRSLQAMMLNQMVDIPTLDIYELELFEWYVRETESILEKMLTAERAFIQEQIDAGSNFINDSGIVAAEYYLKRVRYSHVIYLGSLLETFLGRACDKLSAIAGDHNFPFSVSELKGDQWSIKRKFLERYGRFNIPDSIWSGIHSLISLRNFLAHENGLTNNMKTDVKKKLSVHPGLNLDNYEIVIEAEYFLVPLTQ